MAVAAFPRWWGREWFAALRELVGEHNMASLLRMAQVAPPAEVAPLTCDVPVTALGHLGAALVELYGEEEARRLMRRTGWRVAQRMGHAGRAARLLRFIVGLLPASQALRLGLLTVSELFRQHTTLTATLERLPAGWRWRLTFATEAASLCQRDWLEGLLEGIARVFCGGTEVVVQPGPEDEHSYTFDFVVMREPVGI